MTELSSRDPQKAKIKLKNPDYIFVFSYDPAFKDPKDTVAAAKAEEGEAETPQQGGLCDCFSAKMEKKKAKKARKAIKTRGMIYDRLTKAGCEVHQSLSRDEDEVFMSVNLPDEIVMKHATKMNIRQPLKIEAADDDDISITNCGRTKTLNVKLYATYNIAYHQKFEPNSKESFFSSGIRSAVVFDFIKSDAKRGGAGIKIDKILAKNVGLLMCFPMHDDKKRKRLMHTWARQFWKNQPLDDIREYFGESVAFYFAWLGFYTRWLVYASFIGLIPFLVGMGEEKGDAEGFDNPITPLYCFFISLWSTTFLEAWKREQSVLAFKWGVVDFEENERPRPQYTGIERAGIYVTNQWINLEKAEKQGKTVPKNLYYPRGRRQFKMFFGSPFIISLVLACIGGTMGLLLFRLYLQGTDMGVFWGGTIGGVLNGLTIAILNEVYAVVAVLLNDWENHRTETDYEDNLVLKTFIFQFVNSYLSLFYIAFFKNSYGISSADDSLQDTCDAATGCMGELSAQLLSILITRTVIGNLTEVTIPVIMNRLAVQAESRKMLAEAKKRGVDVSTLNMRLSKAESQAKMAPYTSTIYDYNEMVIQFGYVTLFAAAMPLAAAIALFNNIIEIRTDAAKLLLESQRPVYRVAEDIGSWQGILEVMAVISVLTNMLVLVVTSSTLKEWFGDPSDPVVRSKALWAAIFIEHSLLLIKYLISIMIPDTPAWVSKALANQKYQAELLEDGEESHVQNEEGNLVQIDDSDYEPHANVHKFEEFEEAEDLGAKIETLTELFDIGGDPTSSAAEEPRGEAKA